MAFIFSGIFFSSPYYLIKAYISFPDFVKLGDNFTKVTPPWVSPTNKIGSLWLNAKFVNFGYLTGFYSANLLCLSTFKSNTNILSKIAHAKTVDEYGAQTASTTDIPYSNDIT